jgi:diaminopimelate epimerase
LGLKAFTFYWTETLEPHLVTFDDIQERELNDLGLYLNHSQRDYFPLGINLNKAEVVAKNRLHVTTFERGVNRITAACGTGATSCAMLAKTLQKIQGGADVFVNLKGGALLIQLHQDNAIMSGPAFIEI